MNAKVLIWGGRAHARILNHMILQAGHTTAVIFDATQSGLAFDTEAIFVNQPESLREHSRKCTHFVVAVGAEHGFARSQISEFCSQDLGLDSISLVHPTAYISETAQIGRGFQAMPHAVVHHFTTVGDWCILNTNAHIDHECVVGQGVHVMGGAALAGQVVVGDFASIGTNATILPCLNLAQGTFIGAGAVVVKSTEKNGVYVGSPARMISTRTHAFDSETLRRV